MLRVIDDIHLSEIGNALRETLGEEQQFPPEDMGDAIKYSNEAAFSDGYGSGFEEGEEFGYNTGFADGDELGYQAGMEQGYNSGKAEGIEEGKKAERNEFWNAFYDPYGEGNEIFAGAGWNVDTFYPKKDFNVGVMGFSRHGANRNPYDLAARLNECGVKFLKVNPTQTFQYCKTTTLPILDMSAYPSTRIDRTFMGDKYLISVELIKLGDNRTSDFNAAFSGCSALKEIRFDGVIPNTLSIRECPLSVASLKNIIEHLKDYAENTANHYKYTVTFKTSAFNVLEAEGATAEYNGTACTWAELIGYKKWNLVKA